MEGICVKCGSESGWSGPTWHKWFTPREGADYYKEVLRYACRTCGYERDEQTKDARPLPPPPPPGDIGGLAQKSLPPFRWLWTRAN